MLSRRTFLSAIGAGVAGTALRAQEPERGARKKMSGQASKEGGELAAVEQVVACDGRAEIAKDEVLGHAVVKVS